MRAEASFRGAGPAHGGGFLFSLFTLKSGDLEVGLSRAGGGEVKADVSVRAELREELLPTEAKFGLAYLSSLSVRDINEKYGPWVENAFSRLVGVFEAEGENIEAPELENFRVTSFRWSPPILQASAVAVLSHTYVENVDLPVYLEASGKVGENSVVLDASLVSPSEGPGLENASFGFSVSRRDNLTLLNASAAAKGRMPKEDGMYVVDLSRCARGVEEGRFQQLENVLLPENFHVTLELEVPKGLCVKNQPSAPSYCKTEKCRTYVWEDQDAATAVTSLLSGESTLAIKPVPEGKHPQKGLPFVLVGAAATIACLAVLSGVYFYMREGGDE